MLIIKEVLLLNSKVTKIMDIKMKLKKIIMLILIAKIYIVMDMKIENQKMIINL